MIAQQLRKICALCLFLVLAEISQPVQGTHFYADWNSDCHECHDQGGRFCLSDDDYTTGVCCEPADESDRCQEAAVSTYCASLESARNPYI